MTLLLHYVLAFTMIPMLSLVATEVFNMQCFHLSTRCQYVRGEVLDMKPSTSLCGNMFIQQQFSYLIRM